MFLLSKDPLPNVQHIPLTEGPRDMLCLPSEADLLTYTVYPSQASALVA